MLSGSDASDFQAQLLRRLTTHLQPLDITPRIKIQGDFIQVLVESSQIPDAAAVISVVQRELEALDPMFLRTVRIHGRRVGEKIPAWTETIAWLSLAERLSQPVQPDNLAVVSPPPPSVTREQPSAGYFGQSFAGQDLRDRKFVGMNLAGANFRAMDLTGACFKEANLTGANFQDAELSRANFDQACLTRANFQGANVANTTKLLNKCEQFLSPPGLVMYMIVLVLGLVFTTGLGMLAILLTSGLTISLILLRKTDKKYAIALVRITRHLVSLGYIFAFLLPLTKGPSTGLALFIIAIVHFVILFIVSDRLIVAIEQNSPSHLGAWTGGLTAWLIYNVAVVVLTVIGVGIGGSEPWNALSNSYLGALAVLIIPTLINSLIGGIVGYILAHFFVAKQRLSFCYADLQHANLSHASLTNANFTQANLQNSIFDNTSITGAILPDGQRFDSGIDVQRYTGR